MLVGGKYRKDLKSLSLGEGAYGLVYKARDPENVLVAIKEMKDRDLDKAPTQSGLRELTLQKTLKHDNIVQLLDVYASDRKLYLVFEFLEMNLCQYLKHKPLGCEERMVKDFTQQLMKALEYCHRINLVHRDIKPANILVSSSEKVVKLGDFGCARYVGLPVGMFTSRICTIFYRAPEVMLGIGKHLPSMDVWSLGCVTAELSLGVPVFYTEYNTPVAHYVELQNETKQMGLLLDTLGFPEKSTFPEITELPYYFKYRTSHGKKGSEMSVDKRSALKSLIPNLSSDGIDFLAKLLAISPSLRITAKEALESDYLSVI